MGTRQLGQRLPLWAAPCPMNDWAHPVSQNTRWPQGTHACTGAADKQMTQVGAEEDGALASACAAVAPLPAALATGLPEVREGLCPGDSRRYLNCASAPTGTEGWPRLALPCLNRGLSTVPTRALLRLR